MLVINEQITLADWELSESFVRASGPGGQHVNKTSTAVELRFEAARSPNLPPPVKNRLRQLAGKRWGKDGALTIGASEHRSQVLNRELAREKLIELIQSACHRPKRRIATRPTRGSQRRRMDQKTARGAVKAKRGKVDKDSL